jgi:peroxiredoxin Q/BCP
MSQVEVGQAVPNIELLITGNRRVSLSDYRGKPLVLFFYPKANTPGCTQEGQDFRDAAADFEDQSTVLLGASRDGLKAQENFKAKHGFPFELVSDKDEQLCGLFDVIKMKNMYGKQVRGIERSTFLIDAEGTLRQEWRKVKVKGHVAEVLAAVEALQGRT